MLGQCSQTRGLVLGGVVWSQKLDTMVLGGSFQLRTFCDSMVGHVSVVLVTISLEHLRVLGILWSRMGNADMAIGIFSMDLGDVRYSISLQ